MSWVGWTVFVLSQVPVGAFALLMYLCVSWYAHDRKLLEAALYADSPDETDLLGGPQNPGPFGGPQIPVLFEGPQKPVWNRQNGIDLWESLQEDRGNALVVFSAATAVCLIDCLLLCHVVGTGWPVPTKVSVEFGVLAAGAVIGSFLKVGGATLEFYLWPPAIGLMVCLLLARFWPDAGHLVMGASPAQTAPGSGAHAGASSAGADNTWVVAATVMAAFGTLFTGVAALLRRSGK